MQKEESINELNNELNNDFIDETDKITNKTMNKNISVRANIFNKCLQNLQEEYGVKFMYDKDNLVIGNDFRINLREELAVLKTNEMLLIDFIQTYLQIIHGRNKKFAFLIKKLSTVASRFSSELKINIEPINKIIYFNGQENANWAIAVLKYNLELAGLKFTLLVGGGGIKDPNEFSSNKEQLKYKGTEHYYISFDNKGAEEIKHYINNYFVPRGEGEVWFDNFGKKIIKSIKTQQFAQELQRKLDLKKLNYEQTVGHLIYYRANLSAKRGLEIAIESANVKHSQIIGSITGSINENMGDKETEDIIINVRIRDRSLKKNASFAPNDIDACSKFITNKFIKRLG